MNQSLISILKTLKLNGNCSEAFFKYKDSSIHYVLSQLIREGAAAFPLIQINLHTVVLYVTTATVEGCSVCTCFS